MKDERQKPPKLEWERYLRQLGEYHPTAWDEMASQRPLLTGCTWLTGSGDVLADANASEARDCDRSDTRERNRGAGMIL